MAHATYDKSFLFEYLKKLSETQIGDTRYFIDDKKMQKGLVKKIEFTIQNAHAFPSVKLEGFIHIVIQTGSHSQEKKIRITELFTSKEEAAEQFLKDNDVPVELLRVLKKENTKTVKNLIQNILDNVDPETDLEEAYWEIAKIVEQAYKKKIGFVEPE